jgi:hypothetical protein
MKRESTMRPFSAPSPALPRTPPPWGEGLGERALSHADTDR